MYIGLRAYELLAMPNPGTSLAHYISAAEIQAQFPQLKGDGLKGGIVYYDGQMNDSRHTLALALTAKSQVRQCS